MKECIKTVIEKRIHEYFLSNTGSSFYDWLMIHHPKVYTTFFKTITGVALIRTLDRMVTDIGTCVRHVFPGSNEQGSLLKVTAFNFHRLDDTLELHVELNSGHFRAFELRESEDPMKFCPNAYPKVGDIPYEVRSTRAYHLKHIHLITEMAKLSQRAAAYSCVYNPDRDSRIRYYVGPCVGLLPGEDNKHKPLYRKGFIIEFTTDGVS